MTSILGLTVAILVVALVLVALRDNRVSHHRQTVAQGFGMMLVGLTLISLGLIAVLLDWSSGSFAIPAAGLVLVAVGARRRRGGSNR